MDLSRQLKSTALVLFLITIVIHSSHTRYHGRRLKRQHGAHMYLPESYIIPGGNSSDPNEWGPWSSPSECSRSCGGGVSYQSRDCLNFSPQGSPICQGGNRKYFSCNTQDCPEDEVDFRAQQCSRFNHIPFESVRYEWVPYTKAPNPCELNCMPRGERFYFRHKSKVIDGTRCNDESLDVCVDGQCQSVGCDMMLGSPAREDKCRRCAGDGTSCRTVKGLLDMNNLQVGYNDLLLIPAGATNIIIKEIAPSNNYLACRNLTGHYYLNGNWRIDFPRPMQFAGAWWHYDRRPQGFAAPDHLTCIGPTAEAIYLVLLYQDRNVGIAYEYSVPESVAQSRDPDSYSWTHTSYGPCSASCGTGYQTRVVTCNSRSSLEQVEDGLCDAAIKPADTAQCGQEDCAPHWVEGPWSKCSKPCGSDGKQERTVHCEKIESNGVAAIAEDSVCLKQAGNKPATVQECNIGLKCPKWHVGPWRACNQLCGDGEEKRQIICFTVENGKKKVLPDSECPEEKPEDSKKCMLQPCEGVDWITSSWSGCHECGLTQETRTAICASKDGKIFNDTFCPTEKPELTRPCKTTVCEFQWFASEWSKCSANCGKGVQTRIVLCGQFIEDVVKPATDDSKCDSASKPEVSQECEGEKKDCPGQWFAGPWGNCDKPCGGGERKREVLCMADGKVVSNCDAETIEFSSEKCNPDPCTADETLPITITSKSIEEDDEGEDLCEDEDSDDLDSMEDKSKDSLKLPEGIDLDNTKATETSLVTDELMQSDGPGLESPAGVDTSDLLITSEGSGDDVSSSSASSTTIEGSGDYDEESSTQSSTEFTVETSSSSESTAITGVLGSSTDGSTSSDSSSETEVTSSEESTISGATEITSSDLTSSKDASASTESGLETTSSSSEESSDSTVTDISGPTTQSQSSISSDVSSTSSSLEESTPSGVTDGSTTSSSSDGSTASGSSDGSTVSSSSDGSTASSSSDGSTVSSSSDGSTVSSSSDGSTASSSSGGSTESTSSDGSSISTSSDESTSTLDGSTASSETESTGPTESTESPEPTESTGPTESTESTQSTEPSQSTEPTQSTEFASTDLSKSTDSSSEATTISGSDSTDGSSPGSTEETSIGSTGATDLSSEPTSISGSEATTDGSSLGTTEDSVSGSTVSSLEGTTLASTESGTDTTNTETTESGSTVVSTDVTTGSTESGSTGVSTDVTAESTESRSTEISTGETTESTESGSTGVSTDITGESTTSLSSTDETTSSVTGTTDTSDGTDTTPTSGETDTTAISDETDTTDTSGETTEASSLSTDVSGSTESTVEISTVSESSTSETEGSSTESSGGTDETTIDIWSTSGSETTDEDLFGSTPNTLQAVVTKEQTPRRCKLKKKKAPCLVSKFGCCSDNSTAAKGPFDEGCPIIHTCKDTKYGCCPDEVSPAQGENDEGCPRPPCEGSLFGCCPDGSTEAEGEENEGCPEEITTTTVGGCATSKHGCCPDGETEASGPDNEGCDECVGEECTTIVSETTEQSQETEETSEPDETTMGLDVTTMEPPKESCSYSKYGCCPDGETEATGEEFAGCLGAGPQDCNKSEHGCCRDNRTPAAGPNQEGCSPCLAEPFGCCRDGQTPAHGPNQEGCCLDTRFGCCPDNVNAARGPDFEGCSCEYAPYGCCPDNKTASRGYNKEGCDCKDSEFGCCLDKVTPAKGAKLEGCPCHTFQFGCCPDGTTTAKGPHNYGCQCQQTEFKCCLDEKTAAKGPNFEGCTCLTSRYGCCPDGVSTALGENFEECENVKVAPEKACSLKKDSGPCNNYTVKHFFDTEYGACARFWYGGCDGNGNRFDSIEDCKRTCEQPAGKGACLLPKVAGPCPGYYKKFYYDADRKTCAEFIYGGCLGNNNKFDTIEECQSTCAADETLPPCEQPMEQGPCEGSFERWFYDNQTDVCRPFTYGGCKGNKNNYPSENACQYHCKHPGVHKESCALPKEIGGVECGGRHARWHYSETDKKCMPFYYSGCGGNTNSFVSLEQCEENCPRQVAKDLCEIPAEVGDCANYTARWYYDTANAQCRQFYYGGCGGNQNNFVTEDSCYQRCEPKPEEPKTEVPVAQTEPEPGFSSHNCYLPVQNGPCDQYQERWHYNSDHGVCEHFMYTGCGGNANNFVSEEDCENSCLHVQHTCTLRPLFGNCQDNTTRWYFDERTRHCHEFEFSGCGGNRNNFFNEKECLNFCGQGEEEPPTQGPDIDSRFDETEYSVCDAPLQQGNCREEIAAWFYSREHGQCVAFRYTGCGGNGNRFESQEQCERQCGRYKGVDVCHEEVSPGSCDQWQTRYYFDQSQRLCQPFTYGGCEGTGNRFVSQAECESVCIVHEEPSPMDNKAICALPAASGNCYGPESAKRWYYDDSRGTCVSFIFTGCAGNQNNFRSFESCINFCINTTTAVHVDPGELRTSAPNECQGYQEACRMLQCPYGVGRSHTSEGCERCSCDNPCQNTQCAEGSACAVDIASAPEGTQFIPVCRETNKPGECPSLNNTSSRCGRECRTDADCRNDNKCCSDGCGYVCVRPMERTAVTTSAPRVQVVYPGDRAPALEDKRQEEVNVDTPEGGYATLRCFATGNPPPTITWQRGGIIIDTNQGRFLITSTGDLQIVQVIQSDNGTYVCIADNGIGAPIRREVQLQVTEPRPTDVYILSPRNTTKIVTLTQPARLRCPAGGNPKPLATWWKGQTRIPLMTAAYEQQRDFSLIINSVKLSDLGTYTCEAYAGHGRPTSIKITLKATGPVHVSDESEKEYLKYIIEPKQAPVTEKPKPRYPYRPVRPTDRPIPKPEIPRPAAPGQNIPNVPASAHLRLPSGNSFALGADILMECDVGGSPTPNVTWFKDNALLEPSNKIQITEQPYRLVVYGATLEDSGDYKCNAANSFSINYHQERILVEGVYVHPDCKDNPFFANCKLIVKGLYCSNHYYAKFCCRSCTLAGQIAGSHPNSI